MKSKTLAIAGIIILAAIAATGQPIDSDKMHAYLELTLKNETPEKLRECLVALEGHKYTAGILVPTAAKTYLGWQGPVGTNAIVRWLDAKRVQRETSVSLVSVYDRKISGELIVSITTTNVVATFKKINRE